VDETKLAILEKTGSTDVRELVAEVLALRAELAKTPTVDARLVDAIDDALNHHAARQDDPLRIPRWKSERIAALVNELACDWINVGLQMPKQAPSPPKDEVRCDEPPTVEPCKCGHWSLRSWWHAIVDAGNEGTDYTRHTRESCLTKTERDAAKLAACAAPRPVEAEVGPDVWVAADITKEDAPAGVWVWHGSAPKPDGGRRYVPASRLQAAERAFEKRYGDTLRARDEAMAAMQAAEARAVAAEEDARERRERVQAHTDGLHRAIQSVTAERDSALADVARLTEALQVYGSHRPLCVCCQKPWKTSDACTCGLAGALQPAPADKSPGSVGLAGCGHVDRPGVCEKCAKETASHA
jgi:hypothetical protein